MKIYTTPEPVPSRMLALTRLLQQGPLPENELISLLQPRVDTGMAGNTLNAAIECGLVAREKKRCKLAPGLFEQEPNSTELEEVLPRVLSRLLLAPKISSGANNFATLCAWLLQQPVLKMPRDRVGLKTALVEQGWSLNDLQLQSDLRLDNAIYWARYLGLVCQVSEEICRDLLPDPTVFLRRHLPNLLPAGEDVAIADFCARLGILCPVLDGGVVRDAVLKKIAPQWPEQRLSDSLTFAIERLELSGELKAWCPDDQRTFLLTSPPTNRKIAFLKRTR